MKRIMKFVAIFLITLGIYVVASCGGKTTNIKGKLDATATYSTITMTCTVEDPDGVINTKSIYVMVKNEKGEKVSTHNFTTLPGKDEDGKSKSETLTATGLTANTKYQLDFYCTVGTSEFVFEKREISTTNEGLNEDNPILINNANDLYGMTNNLNAFYKLNADIDLGSTNRSAIFNSSNPFNGSLDGNNHTISNFLTTNSNQEIALFGYVGQKGVIKNVNVNKVSLGNDSTKLTRSSETRLGSFVSTNLGKLSNNKVTELQVNFNSTTTSSSTEFYLGGFVGLNRGIVENCSVDGTMTVSLATKMRVGGFVGLDDVANAKYSITSSKSNVQLNAKLESKSSQGSDSSKYTVVEYVGGFAGEVSGHIKDCASLGSIDATYEYAYATAIINPLGAAIGGFAGTISDQGWVLASLASNNIKLKSTSAIKMDLGLFAGNVALHANCENFKNNVVVENNKSITLELTVDGVYKRTKSVTVDGETKVVEIDRTMNLGFYGDALDEFKTNAKAYYHLEGEPTFNTDVATITYEVEAGAQYASLTLSDFIKGIYTSLVEVQ